MFQLEVDPAKAKDSCCGCSLLAKRSISKINYACTIAASKARLTDSHISKGSRNALNSKKRYYYTGAL